jgi:hypothetical protein
VKRLFNRDALACHAELLTPSLGVGPPTRLSVRTSPAKRSESINDGHFTAERVVKRFKSLLLKAPSTLSSTAFISLDGSCDIRASL